METFIIVICVIAVIINIFYAGIKIWAGLTYGATLKYTEGKDDLELPSLVLRIHMDAEKLKKKKWIFVRIEYEK